MKQTVSILILVFSFLSVPVLAKNQCACLPIPTSKSYIGEPRKKHAIGYSIDWTCTYNCKLDRRDEDSTAVAVKGTYHEYHVLEENGLEGICEGMVYKAQYNPTLNRDIYMYTGENVNFSPSDSKAIDLKTWGASNNCE